MAFAIEPPLAAVAFAVAVVCLAFGVWAVTGPVVPAWMRGALKWPYGDNLSAAVMKRAGLGSITLGMAALLAAYLLVVQRSLVVRYGTALGVPWFRAAYVTVIALLVIGAAVYIWGLILSRDTR